MSSTWLIASQSLSILVGAGPELRFSESWGEGLVSFDRVFSFPVSKPPVRGRDRLVNSACRVNSTSPAELVVSFEHLDYYYYYYTRPGRSLILNTRLVSGAVYLTTFSGELCSHEFSKLKSCSHAIKNAEWLCSVLHVRCPWVSSMGPDVMISLLL